MSEDECCVVAKNVVRGRDGTSEGGHTGPLDGRSSAVAAIAFRNDTAICVDCPLRLLPAGVLDAANAFSASSVAL